MVANSSTSIFVPVLVLVIIEISQAAREYDLVEIAHQKQEPFFYSVFYILDQSSQEAIRIPQLGPFNFIHGMNLAILHLGYVLVVITSEGNVRVVTALIIWLFWVLFPMLEVYEYVSVMDNPDIGPVSFLYHSIVTTVAAGMIFFFSDLLQDPIQANTVGLPTILFILAIIIVYYSGLIGFLSLLEGELEQCDLSPDPASDSR